MIRKNWISLIAAGIHRRYLSPSSISSLDIPLGGYSGGEGTFFFSIDAKETNSFLLTLERNAHRDLTHLLVAAA